MFGKRRPGERRCSKVHVLIFLKMNINHAQNARIQEWSCTRTSQMEISFQGDEIINHFYMFGMLLRGPR